MIVRFLHHNTDIDTMVKVEQELLSKKFKPTQFSFTEKFDKVVCYDVDLLKMEKFLKVFRKYGVVII